MSTADTARAATANSPYIGLPFYTQENATLFFGRDSEQMVLISNLRASRLTLLYAQSGVGKSSLLRAGVASRLTEMAQRNLIRRGTARYIPVVFSSWRDDPTAELIDEVWQAIVPFLPTASPPGPAPDRLDEAIEAATIATSATLLVILDQFEEYFLYRSREVRSQPFADELAACLNRGDIQANFLISIREDAYSGLGDLFKGKISNVYGNYFRLEHLTREAAREAIEKPIVSFNELHKDKDPVLIEPELVDAVLGQFRPIQFTSDLGGVGRLADGNGARPHRDEVAAPYLQLVMKRLWDEELSKHSRKLRLQTLKELGGAQTIVHTHVDRALGDLSDEDREAAVDILHHLVTPSGTKIALAASDLTEYTARSADEVNVMLQRLADSDIRILSPVPPPPGGPDGTRFEILHDLLAPAILDWGRRRKAIRLEREKEAAEQQAQAEKKQAQAEKKRARRFAALAIGTGALLVVAVILAFLADGAENAAVSRSHQAQSEEMAAEAMNLLPANGPLAMLLSLQAYERDSTFQAASALIQAAQQPLNKLLVSGGAVRSVAFSPDGRTLAVGDDAGHIGLWDVATGQRMVTLAESNPVWMVAFSPGGRTLAVGDNGGNVGLWNVATRHRTATLTEGSIVHGLAFSPDGRTLAVGGYNGDVGLWNVATRHRTATLTEGSTVEGVAFSPDGRILAVGDNGGGVGLWNVGTGHRTATLTDVSAVRGVAFSPDGRTLAVGGYSGDVGLWDVATGHRTTRLAEGAPAGVLAFSPDGRTLAVGDIGGHVGLWDVMHGHQIATLAEGSAVTYAAFSPDGRTLAAGDDSGDVGLWDVATGQRPSAIVEGSPVGSVAFSPDGRTLAAGDNSGDVGLWDVATGHRIAVLAEHSLVKSVAFSLDGRTLAVGDYGGDVGLWDIATRHRTATLAEGSLVGSVAFNPDGRTLAAGDNGGDVGLWDVATGHRTATLSEHSTVERVAFSPDGRTLAVGDVSAHVGLWDVATRHRTATLADDSIVYAVAFSPDGKTLAVGDNGGDVRLWDVATRHRTGTIAEGSTISSVAFTPGGQALVIGDSLGNVGIWDPAAERRIANLAEGSAISSLAFSSDGHVLAIGSLNGNIALLWQNLADLNQRSFMHLICGKIRVNMTKAEWADYAPGQPYQKTCP